MHFSLAFIAAFAALSTAAAIDSPASSASFAARSVEDAETFESNLAIRAVDVARIASGEASPPTTDAQLRAAYASLQTASDEELRELAKVVDPDILDLLDEISAANRTQALDSRAPQVTPQQATDTLLYNTAMPQFLVAKRNRNPSYLDWNSNGCTFWPDYPAGFNFFDSCNRHDFGYRNYKAQRRCSSDDRKRVDDNLKRDTTNECNKYGIIKKLVCLREVAKIYLGVRALGGTVYCH